ELRRTLTLPAQGRDWAWHAMLQEFPGVSDVVFRFVGSAPDQRPGSTVFDSAADEPWPFSLALAAVTLDWCMLVSTKKDVVAHLDPAPVQRMVRAMRQSLRISNE